MVEHHFYGCFGLGVTGALSSEALAATEGYFPLFFLSKDEVLFRVLQ